LAKLIGTSTGGEATFLKTALEQGDPVAKGVLDETAEDLAFALSHVVHLFHPEMIVLGGGLSLTGEPLRAAVEKFLPRFTMEAFAPGPRIALARLGEGPARCCSRWDAGKRHKGMLQLSAVFGV
jgi:glucokinase